MQWMDWLFWTSLAAAYLAVGSFVVGVSKPKHKRSNEGDVVLTAIWPLVLAFNVLNGIFKFGRKTRRFFSK